MDDGKPLRSIANLKKRGIAKLVKDRVVDHDKWTLFARNHRDEFITHFHQSRLNKATNSPHDLPFPAKFEPHIVKLSKSYIMQARQMHAKTRPTINPNSVKTYSKWKPINVYNITYIGSYHDIITELNTLLRTKKHDGLFDKRCRCDDVILNGYNLKVICLTMHCDIACKCGTLYMKYAFGKQVMIDNKLYHENMLRFTSLVTHMKVRYSLGKGL
eukprot:976757_1